MTWVAVNNLIGRGLPHISEVQNFKMVNFLMFLKKKKTSKMKENVVALIITCEVSNYTKTIILLRLSEFC